MTDEKGTQSEIKSRLEKASEYKTSFEDRPDEIFPNAEFHALGSREVLARIECNQVEIQEFEWVHDIAQDFIISSMGTGLSIEIFD